MKKKLALLMAAIMTVAMVPMTAFAASNGSATISADNMRVAADDRFTSNVELYKKKTSSTADDSFVVKITLENGVFDKYTKDDTIPAGAKKGDYINEKMDYSDLKGSAGYEYIKEFDVTGDSTAIVKLGSWEFNETSEDGRHLIIPIVAKGVSAGEVVATFESTVSPAFVDSEVIATVKAGKVSLESAGTRTFVEGQKLAYNTVKTLTLEELTIGALSSKGTITGTLKGNFALEKGQQNVKISDKNNLFPNVSLTVTDDETITINLGEKNTALDDGRTAYITIEGLNIKPTKSCDAGDVATLTLKSKDFDTVKFEVAKMVEEAVTYTVEDDELPRLWAGQLPKNNDDNEGESLSIFIEENTGDILNTSRKATFTFPEGIEVVSIKELDGVVTNGNGYTFEYEIDENVVSIWNYGEDAESDATDMEISFILSAAPTFTGDVTCTLGGEFDDVEFKVATVEAPYTIEAKTSEVLIDYRYVPVNEIVITEAEDGILKDNDKIFLQVEKMDFEDAGSYEVTEGDIEVNIDIEDGDTNVAQLEVTIKDSSTEASTIVISGLELYLDRTLPVGGYALENIMTYSRNVADAHNILWENSTDYKDSDDVAGYNYVPAANQPSNGLFKYSAITVNDSYVEVVTQARDQDDYTTSRKIVITIGATTMAVGTETVTLDAPAYINAENYTELPLRAVSEAFGATVAWDDASRTVTVMMGQRIVSMTIGSKTMYINGTPVAMNTAPEITADRTFVPVRDLANALGISKIDWNEAAATVTLN